MTQVEPRSVDSATPADEAPSALQVVERWLAGLEAELASTDPAALYDLFEQDSYWRDLVALTWSLQQRHGVDQIVEGLRASAVGPHEFGLSSQFLPPREVDHWGRHVVESAFTFRTSTGAGNGIVRLVPDPQARHGSRAWLLLTSLQDLDVAAPRPATDPVEDRYGFTPAKPLENWKEFRDRTRDFEDRDPEVLVVGGGHCGLMAAAHLGALGVDTLVVDRYPQAGDVWRRRYHSLTLHFPTVVSQFPYLPFPPSYPKYLSKDQLANWLEVYVEAMQLNLWTSAEFTSATFDAESGTWTATVERDGQTRTLHPRHIVMAPGAFGTVPRIPELPGLDTFQGEVVHTSRFEDGRRYAGRSVAVVGAGASGHDTAVEIQRSGGTVTMLQRSPVKVVDIETSARLPWAGYPAGVSIAEVDLLTAANIVFPLAREAIKQTADRQAEADAELHAGLEAAGFQVDRDTSEGGWQLDAWRKGAGYYINVGASNKIAEGAIEVLQMDRVARFVPTGIELDDGEVRSFDAVILATGFHNARVDLARLFGEDVAARIGGIWQLDDHGTGEWTNTWVPTSQENLWFNAGAFPQARFYSRLLALQIKARLAEIPID